MEQIKHKQNHRKIKDPYTTIKQNTTRTNKI